MYEDRHLFFYLYEYSKHKKWEKVASCNFNYVKELALEKPLKKEIAFTWNKKKNIFGKRDQDSITVLHFSIISTKDDDGNLSKAGSDVGSDLDDSDLSDLDRFASAKNLKPLVVVPTLKESKSVQTKDNMDSVRQEVIRKDEMIEKLRSEYDKQVSKYKDQIFKKQINFKEREQTDYRRIRSLLDENSTLKRNVKENEQRNEKQQVMNNKKISQMKRSLSSSVKKIDKLKRIVKKSRARERDMKEGMGILKKKYASLKMELQKKSEDRHSEILQLENEKDKNMKSLYSSHVWESSALVLSIFYGFISVFVCALKAKETDYSLKYYAGVLVLFSTLSYLGFRFGKRINLQSSILLHGKGSTGHALKTFFVQSIIYGVLFGLLLPFISRTIYNWTDDITPLVIEEFNQSKYFSCIIKKVFVDVFISDVLLLLFTFSFLYDIIDGIQRRVKMFARYKKFMILILWVAMGAFSALFSIYVNKDRTIAETISLSILGMFLVYMFWVLETIEFVMFSHIISLSMYYYLYSIFFEKK